jgi:primosomal protein N' (replication factor Y)
MSRLASVAVPVPFLEALTYTVPDDVHVERGMRVVVPLGRRFLTGCVLAVGGGEDEGAGGAAPANGRRLGPAIEGSRGTPPLRSIVRVLDDEPFLPADVLDLALWVADYYLCGPGEAVACAMPPLAWTASERACRLTPEGAEAAPAASGLERLVLEVLGDGVARRPAAIAAAVGARLGGGVRRAGGRVAIEKVVRSLARRGWVRIEQAMTGAESGFRTVRIARLTAQGHDLEAAGRLTPRQRTALELLARRPEGVTLMEAAASGVSAAVLEGLRRRGLVAFGRERVERGDRPAWVLEAGEGIGGNNHAATPEQEAALSQLLAWAAEGRYRTVLLHGVTGSGKTEVYRRLAEAVVARGRRVLVLVPEIALTPAVAGLFRATFGGRVAIQHSGLSNGERHDQWHRIRRGDVDVVVGTRSAVFAPLAAPGLVIVDEEHDTSYKQEETPRYHGRDVAVVRGRAAGALVVLGSATPSLESYQNAVRGRYHLLTLTRRVLDRPLAQVRVVNMRSEMAEAGPDVVISGALREALAARLAAGEQAIVLLNRRGFATSVFCRQCGDTLECPNCSVALTVHRAAGRARCHYCEHARPVPERCSRCGGTYLEYAGVGTERVEAELRALFPAARVARVDRDTIRRRGEIARLLGRFRTREIDVLVGTQMIAKGHDFPAVTLVGVVSADVGLGLADFRAAERTFQLLTQVAGRAGRGDVPGEAIIQTLFPDHYSIQLACTQDYAAFFAREIRYREAMRYPPAVALVNLVVRGASEEAAFRDAAELARELRRSSEAYRVLGPAPAPLPRLRGHHRAQIFLKGTSRTALRAALRRVLAGHPDLVRRVTVDVDPISVL